jgi:hypothetical protein
LLRVIHRNGTRITTGRKFKAGVNTIRLWKMQLTSTSNNPHQIQVQCDTNQTLINQITKERRNDDEEAKAQDDEENEEEESKDEMFIPRMNEGESDEVCGAIDSTIKHSGVVLVSHGIFSLKRHFGSFVSYICIPDLECDYNRAFYCTLQNRRMDRSRTHHEAVVR